MKFYAELASDDTPLESLNGSGSMIRCHVSTYIYAKARNVLLIVSAICCKGVR